MGPSQHEEMVCAVPQQYVVAEGIKPKQNEETVPERVGAQLRPGLLPLWSSPGVLSPFSNVMESPLLCSCGPLPSRDGSDTCKPLSLASRLLGIPAFPPRPYNFEEQFCRVSYIDRAPT